MGARWYSPELTRFLSQDPIKGDAQEPLSQNPYLYCADDPLNHADPTGKSQDPDSPDEPTLQWDLGTSGKRGLSPGRYWDSMADPIKEEQAAARARAEERENFERLVMQALERIRADFRAAIEAGTMNLGDLGLSELCLSGLRGHYNNLGDDALLARLIEYLDLISESDMPTLVANMKYAAKAMSQEWGTGKLAPVYLPKDMEMLLLYYTDLDLGEIEICMDAFMEQWEKTVQECEVKTSRTRYLNIAMQAYVALGLAYGLGPYLLPGIGSLAEEGMEETSAVETSVFWTGGDDVMYAAQAWAEANGATTLEMTGLGQELAPLGQGTHYATYPLWQTASARFAGQAQGIVHVFQPYMPNIGVDLGNIWSTIEYPALMANPDVTGFVYHLVTEYGNIIEIGVAK